MKRIMFLSLLVVATHQQQLPRRGMMPFPYLHPSHFDDQDYSDGMYFKSPYRPRVFILLENGETMPMDDELTLNEHERYAQSELRVRDVEQRNLFNYDEQQADDRFVYVNVPTHPIKQPFTQTATFSVTSTCTALTVSSCIPRINLFPVAPFGVPNCRRKRSEFNHHLLGEDDNNSQFSAIHPSKVGLVLTTAVPQHVTMKDDATHEVDIVSSQEEKKTDYESKGISISDKHKLIRKGQFLTWNSVTSLTKTTWSVVSSVFTSTYVPALNLQCLPPGYIICLEAGK